MCIYVVDIISISIVRFMIESFSSYRICLLFMSFCCISFPSLLFPSVEMIDSQRDNLYFYWRADKDIPMMSKSHGRDYKIPPSIYSIKSQFLSMTFVINYVSVDSLKKFDFRRDIYLILYITIFRFQTNNTNNCGLI